MEWDFIVDESLYDVKSSRLHVFHVFTSLTVASFQYGANKAAMVINRLPMVVVYLSTNDFGIAMARLFCSAAIWNTVLATGDWRLKRWKPLRI